MQEEQLRKHNKCRFFTDEFRSPVCVQDIVRIVQWLLSAEPKASSARGIYNMGGPERLTRMDMAQAVAKHCKHDVKYLQPALSADVQRAAPSPADISMNSTKLQALLPFKLRKFEDGLSDCF